MKAKEKAPDLDPAALDSFRDHLIATNIRLPKGKDHLQAFLKNHPEDRPLRSALEAVFQGLENAHELGSLLQIEEPVEKELRYLKAKSEENKGKLEQQALFGEMAQPKQGELPLGVESYEQWKTHTLARLRSHFGDEAEAADPVQAFFGQSVQKGLALFDLLSRRYDVVAANPPYMGFRKFGSRFLEKMKLLYVETYKDIYSSFIEKAGLLINPSGSIAIISLNTWLSLEDFSNARACIFERTPIVTMAVLGTGTFHDLSNTNAMGFCMFVLSATKDTRKPSLFIDCSLDHEKESALLSRIRDARYLERSHADFNAIPGVPVAYAAPDSVLKAFATHRPVRSLCRARQGLKTGDNDRFLRFVWECPSWNWRIRWFPCTRGGNYRRWRGNFYAAGDWEYEGVRLRNFVNPAGRLRSRPQNTEIYFQEGITWTTQTSYGFSARKVDKGLLIESAGPLAIPNDLRDLLLLLGILNCRLVDFLYNLVQPKAGFGEGYIEKLPLPTLDPAAEEAIRDLAAYCVTLARSQETLDIDSAYAKFSRSVNERISSRIKHIVLQLLTNHMLRHIAEAKIELIVREGYEISESDYAVYERVGTPVGWFPMIARYDAIPQPIAGLPQVPLAALELLEHRERRTISPQMLDDLKDRLRILYEAGPRAKEETESFEHTPGEEDDTEDELPGVRTSVPSETLLEELSIKLRVHPVSVYWLLQEGCEKEGWRCAPEEQRFTEDVFTVTVLRLLGHRWPEQIEAGERSPDWADRDGIIPITEGSGEKALLERVREHIADEFPGGNVASIEREFEEIVGTRLEKWLAGPFFKRHVSQFKKRPIAWQVELGTRGQGLGARGKRKAAGYNSGPVFSCLLYYHKLDADLLPKIRSHYVGSLRSGYETELRALERIENPTAEQGARKVQLTNWIDELKALDEKLSEVIVSGFGLEGLQSQLRQFAIDDAMLALRARWLRKLVGVVREGPLASWKQAAYETDLHPEFPKWIQDGLTHLDYHCSAVGPKAPEEKTLSQDPDSAYLAALICREAESMVRDALTRACQTWWKHFDEAVIAPVRQQIAELNEQIKRRKEERELVDLQTTPYRRVEIEREIEDLKDQVSALKAEQAQKVAAGQRVRAQIEGWTCPEAERWQPWLAAQPLYDQTSGLDERRSPPRTVSEFIAQESAYAPDINDGVRVNIAPLQRAGLLSAEVIVKKDVDKAIADRAEWRADERRWCREGKLPYPGWWKKQQEEAPLTLEAAT